MVPPLGVSDPGGSEGMGSVGNVPYPSTLTGGQCRVTLARASSRPAVVCTERAQVPLGSGNESENGVVTAPEPGGGNSTRGAGKAPPSNAQT